MQTRQLFWQMDPATVRFFYFTAFAVIGLVAVGIGQHLRRYLRAGGRTEAIDLWRGSLAMVRDVLTHRTIKRRDAYAGFAHRAIFFGFALLFMGTAIVTVEEDFTYPLFGIRFWHGWFYLGFKLVMNMAGAALIIGLVMMMARRALFHLSKLDYRRTRDGEKALTARARKWRIEDWVFLVVLLAIALSGFFQAALRLQADNPPMWDWSPVAYALARLLAAAGITQDAVANLRHLNWFGHGGLALAFVISVAWTKGKHMIVAFASLAVRDPGNLRRLRGGEGQESPAVSTLAQFSWKDLVHLDACTKCGRCHEACPAQASGYPLSPRDFILDLRLAAKDGKRAAGPLIGPVISPETLWACRTCGACAEICPVGIEHPSKIVRMRRELVDRGEMDPILRGVLETVVNSGNSFGEPARKRGSWTKDLEFPVKDVRQDHAEALWFVGDFASFDPRSQTISRTVARIFRTAGLDFGLLYDGERTAGNDIRRVGEEGLFEDLANRNTEQMKKAKFEWIVTTDPHSFNTLRNEYPAAISDRQIRHYSSVLAELLESGKLQVARPLQNRVTFHDPCHLGRYNKEYDAPRRVLDAIGCELVEMPRNRDNSFCCGAGGGRIWIPDPPGTEKPAHSRMHEASSLDIEVFVTCCPKDLAMFEDARKASGHEGDFVVADLAELVAEAIELKAITASQIPDVIERLVNAVADRLVDRIVDAVVPATASRLLTAIPSAASASAAALPAQPPGAPPAAATAPPANKAAAQWSAVPVQAASLTEYECPAKSGFRVLVAVKHVAKLGEEFAFTEGGQDVREEDREYQLNEFDDTALEEALSLVEKLGGGEVVVATIGPEAAEESLRKALAKGAHRAVRIWHEGLTVWDPIAIGSLLSGLARHEQADLVFTGVQSSDFASGSTASALARMLGWSHAAVVCALEWEGGDRVGVRRELEGGLQHRFTVPLPTVLSIQAGANVPRYATMRMIKDARTKRLAVTRPLDSVACSGVVLRMLTPPVTRATMIEGSPAEAAAVVAQIIRTKKGS